LNIERKMKRIAIPSKPPASIGDQKEIEE